MADGVDVKFTGIETLRENIARIVHVATPQAVKKGTLRVAAMIERDAKSTVPVDTGRLRASISQNWTDSGKPSGDVQSKAKPGDGIGQPQNKPDTFSAVVGTNVEYAEHVEWRDDVNHPVGGAHFLYGAYFRNEDKVKLEIASEWGKEIAKNIKQGTK